jgi:hypothetical protein
MDTALNNSDIDIDVSCIYNYLNKTKLNTKLDSSKFDEIIDQLSENIFNYGFDNLIKRYNEGLQTVQKDWQNLKSKNINTNNISSTTTTGVSIIKRFMPHIYEVENFKGKSIKKLFTKENIKNALIVNRKTHSTPYVSEFIRQLGFMAGTTKVTIYRPLLTKRVVQYFEAKNVLDVCVGWGGRMIGSACLEGVKYTGIEPFSKTYNGLNKIKEELSLDNVSLYNDKAEDIIGSLPKEFDIAITSPPYYNLEIYSDEDSQSHNYGSYENWKSHFLEPVVVGVLNCLIEGGKSCWSVKNFKTDKKYNLFDDIKKIHMDNGWELLDSEFYVGNCIRPGLKTSSGSAAKSKEITYIFAKK